MIALASVDLLVARAVLPGDQAGLYALGAVVTKIAFWLPAPVSVVFYPQMSHPEQSVRAVRTTLLVLAGIGALNVVVAFVAAPLVPLIVGDAYAPIEGVLWAFALNGAFLAVLQGALFASIAAEYTWLAAIAWIALIAEFVLLTTIADTVGQFIAVAAISAAVAATLASALTLRLTSSA
jgi:O-antigen/teichoic acid export membrane protein